MLQTDSFHLRSNDTYLLMTLVVTNYHYVTLILILGEKQLERLELDELDELEDELDEKVILEYRAKRIAEMKAEAAKANFGDVREISAEDYVQHVNNAGEGVWVILHLFKPG